MWLLCSAEDQNGRISLSLPPSLPPSLSLSLSLFEIYMPIYRSLSFTFDALFGHVSCSLPLTTKSTKTSNEKASMDKIRRITRRRIRSRGTSGEQVNLIRLYDNYIARRIIIFFESQLVQSLEPCHACLQQSIIGVTSRISLSSPKCHPTRHVKRKVAYDRLAREHIPQCYYKTDIHTQVDCSFIFILFQLPTYYLKYQ
ncbi:hypothetical protein HDV57DRAFT_184305 [Trichoderma longibrachiatum]